MQACQPGQPVCLASPQTVPSTAINAQLAQQARKQPVQARISQYKPASLAQYLKKRPSPILSRARVQDGIDLDNRSLVRARTRRNEKLQPKHVKKSDSKMNQETVLKSDSKTCRIETKNRKRASPKIRRARCSKNLVDRVAKIASLVTCKLSKQATRKTVAWRRAN